VVQNKAPPNCLSLPVIVLDTAKFHNSVINKIISKGSTKKGMMEYLDQNINAYEKTLLKAQIFIIIKASSVKGLHITDVVAAEHDHEVLRISVGHCQLNLIEVVLAQGKAHVATNNKDLTTASI
jgi:hypothetical protein